MFSYYIIEDEKIIAYKKEKNNIRNIPCYLEYASLLCYTNNMMDKYGINLLRTLGARENIPLASLSTFHIGGPASFVIEASNAETVLKTVTVCRDSHYPVALIGNGSNILFPDEGFAGVIIKIKRSETLPYIRDGIFKAFAGDLLVPIAKHTVKNGYSGFERLAGIPGSIGGAIAMNAGAYGGEIKDVLHRVHIIRNFQDEWLESDESQFGYRKSPFTWPGSIILEAEFRISKGDGTESSVMEDCLQKRREKQPLEFPSAGSVFKRPVGYFAGKLIEDAGLKECRIGGAEVSEKHAGFIINKGGATEKDVLTLINHIQQTVLSLYGVSLEREVLRLEEIACTF